MHADAIRQILEDHNPWWSDAKARRAVSFPARRDLHARLIEYVGMAEARRAVLLIGPRQVGKTVLLLQLADELLAKGWPAGNITYFDFSDDRLTEEINPRSILNLTPVAASLDRPRVFLLDEISKAAKWGPWLKQAVDTRKDRFVVTDSAASVLRTETSETGQGRWDELRIEGLSFSEFLRLIGIPDDRPEQTFRRIPNVVERYLATGGFPEHVLSDDFYQVRERIRADIADRAIRRDLLRLGVDVERLRALFVYLVQDSGAIFNASIRARDMSADPRSITQWVSLLEDTHLVKRLERRAGSAASRLRSQPRIYASDHGLIAAFAPKGYFARDPHIRGRVAEAVVFRHLRDVARAVGGELTFFRRNDELESDFVLDFKGGPIVVEVTASSDPASRKFNRLAQAGEMLRASRIVMIHTGIVDTTDAHATELSLARFLMKPLLLLGQQHE